MENEITEYELEAMKNYKMNNEGHTSYLVVWKG
jgi:hypothetical protein